MPKLSDRHYRNVARQAVTGLTLIELMIAMVLGLVVIAAIGALFLSTSRNFHEDEQIARTQDELRFALARTADSLEHIGFWSPMFDFRLTVLDASVTTAFADVANHCNWALDAGVLNRVMDYLDNPTSAQVAARFPCIDATTVQVGSDVIAGKSLLQRRVYLVDNATCVDSRVGMEPGRIYLRTNGTDGVLFVQGATGSTTSPAAAPPACPYEYWEYEPAIHYVRNYTRTPGDGVPALCRMILSPNGGAPRIMGDSAGCIASGIEDLQIEFGIDRLDRTGAVSTGPEQPPDGAPEYYVTAPTAVELGMSAALKLFLVSRSAEPGHGGYRNVKQINVSNSALGTPNDRFYRRTASTVVLLRNPTALRFYE